MTYKTPLKVRTYECDSYNHVNNAVYLNYLEYGRMDFLKQIGFDYKGIIQRGFYIYVSHVDIYYKASAFFDDDLIVESTSVKLKTEANPFNVAPSTIPVTELDSGRAGISVPPLSWNVLRFAP